jgi:hypothetical protein
MNCGNKWNMTSVKSVKRIKDKKCRWCKELFIPAQSMQVVCTPRCALAYSLKKKAKAFKADTAVMKKAIKDKDRAYWQKRAQTVFNAWIRQRDTGLPCISCGAVNPPSVTGGQWDAGHFKTRGAYPELRFTEDNCHKQCKKCNGGGGNWSSKARTVDEMYEIELIKRIGIERVEVLKAPHPPAKWSIAELKEIEREYKAKLRTITDSIG